MFFFVKTQTFYRRLQSRQISISLCTRPRNNLRILRWKIQLWFFSSFFFFFFFLLFQRRQILLWLQGLGSSCQHHDWRFMSITSSSRAALNSLNFLITTTAHFNCIDTITQTKTQDETKAYFKLRSSPWSASPHSYTNTVAPVQTKRYHSRRCEECENELALVSGETLL